MKVVYSVLIFAATISCRPEKHPVAFSLTGKAFYEPERTAEVQARLESDLATAKADWEQTPSEENFIWYGRRLGYLSRFQQAIDIFSKGIELHPESARLYRHRGHRFISIRSFDQAITDFIKARNLMQKEPLEIEPDGIPNKANIPLSSTQFNILYHLGVAHYLKGNFGEAQKAFTNCLSYCENDDLLIACVDWLYMTNRKQGLQMEANSILSNVKDTMKIIENDSYYRRCLMYQGKIPQDSLLKIGRAGEDVELVLATQGYGVGNWYLVQGDSAKAKALFQKVVAGKHFSAFGFIAAEAELARWQE